MLRIETMADNRMIRQRLACSIVQFLDEELASGSVEVETKESLEVASQCLQAVYGMSSEDPHLQVSKPLIDIFKDATSGENLEGIQQSLETLVEKLNRILSRGELMVWDEMMNQILDTIKGLKCDLRLDRKNGAVPWTGREDGSNSPST